MARNQVSFPSRPYIHQPCYSITKLIITHISPAIMILGLEECFADLLSSSCDASFQLFMMMIVCPITVIELIGPGRCQQMARCVLYFYWRLYHRGPWTSTSDALQTRQAAEGGSDFLPKEDLSAPEEGDASLSHFGSLQYWYKEEIQGQPPKRRSISQTWSRYFNKRWKGHKETSSRKCEIYVSHAFLFSQHTSYWGATLEVWQESYHRAYAARFLPNHRLCISLVIHAVNVFVFQTSNTLHCWMESLAFLGRYPSEVASLSSDDVGSARNLGGALPN